MKNSKELYEGYNKNMLFNLIAVWKNRAFEEKKKMKTYLFVEPISLRFPKSLLPEKVSLSINNEK